MASIIISGIYTLNSVNTNSAFEDTTDYDSQGLNPGDYEGRLKAELTTSSGQYAYYDNLSGTTPDITPGVVNVKTIPLPNDPLTNYPIKGIYTITYELRNIQTQVNTYYTITFTFDFTVPEICIEREVNCNSSLIKTTDITAYTGYLIGSPTRTHILYPPPASALTPQSVTTPINIYNNIVTTTWSVKITSVCTWYIPTSNDVQNVFFIASITGTDEILVDCNTDLCSLLCCVKEINTHYNELYCSNTIEAARYLQQRVLPSTILIMQILASQGCGKPSEVALLIAELKKVSGCTNCGCAGEGPQVVLPQTGSGSGNNVVIDSPLLTISVVPETVGTTTTYHLEVSQTIRDTIANLHNTIIQSLDNSIVVTGPTLQPNGNWLYNIQTAAANITPAIEVWMRVENSGGFGVTPTFIQRIGSNVSAAADFKFILGDVNPGSPTSADAVFIYITDFFIQPQIFTCAANVMKYDFNVSRDAINTIGKTIQPFEAHILYNDADVPRSNIYVRLNYNDGTPVLLTDLAEFGNKVDIRLTIKPQVS